MLTRIRRRLEIDDGITLVELMVAFFILGIVLTGLASVLITSLRSVMASESRLRATQLANEVLEELQAWDWDDLDNHWGSSGDEQTYELDNAVFQVTADIIWVDDPATSASEDYRRFEVTVSWTDYGASRSLTKTALRAPAPHEQRGTQFSLRDVVVEPNLGYLRMEGQVEKYPSGGVQHVTLSAVTTAPLDADQVWVEFVDGFGQLQTVNLQGSEGNTVWTRTGTGGWRFRNGDTEFHFYAENYPGDQAKVVVVARYVHQTIEVPEFVAYWQEQDPEGSDDPERVERDWICVDEGSSVEDIVIRAGFRGLTADDVVTVSSNWFDPEEAVVAGVLQEQVDTTKYAVIGTAFEVLIPGGQEYPEGTVTFEVAGERGFDAATGPADVAVLTLEVRELGAAGCEG